MIRIASAPYKIELISNWELYASKIEHLVIDAKKAGANLLLLPEYCGIEAVCKKFRSDDELFYALEPLLPKYIDLFKTLAVAHKIYIQAGTIIQKITQNTFANRAYFFSPNGSYDYQDKLQLTASEKNRKIFQRGNHQKVFETPIGNIGIAICYDSEFPEIVQRLVQKGASIILVPSYTTTLAGFNRVYLSCRARAIENQCYVAVSYVIGTVDLSDEVDETCGQATIFGPADRGFPDDGIITKGSMNELQLVIGDLSVDKLIHVRKEGDVHNFEDTKHSMTFEEAEIQTVRL